MENMERENSRIHQKVVRLNRYLAMAGIGSRRKNDELILSGGVKINGKVVTEMGTKVVLAKDHVSINGTIVTPEQKNVYILFNKPKDVITTMSDERGRETVMNFVRTKYRVFPVGRLDRNTTGVLLFTNDGDFSNALTHPKFGIEKVYRVTIDKTMQDDDLKKLRKGIHLKDGLAKAQSAEIVEGTKRKKVLVVLHEGRNREVRRMFEALEYDVRQLDRVAFAGLTTLGVPRGRWRMLSFPEVKDMKHYLGLE
jgi:23S rRNA pseudouridine2605 synthase